MQKLAEICIRRPVFATMIILALVVVGAFSYSKLGVDLFPKVDFPTVIVTTTLPGASPEEMESEVTKKLEEAVNTIEGIDALNSVSAEGVSQVVVTFVLERKGNEAANDVRDRVSRILKDLPRDVDPPVIERIDPDATPILSIVVSADRAAREITEIADKKIKQQIESISGVGQVRFIGERQRQIQVRVDAAKLAAYNINIEQVRQAVGSQNVEVPGGRIDEGRREMILRTLGRYERPGDFETLIVGMVKGAPVRISDIGQVEDGIKEPRSLARLDGKEAVVLEVRKQSGTNTVEVVSAVKERLEEVKRVLPGDFRLQIVRDQSTFIKSSIKAIREHLILGGILAALVVLLFIRNWRSTLIAAIAIPTSIISTFGLIYYMGFTLNNQTMLALVLVVGIVIDDAIVVLENTFRFMEEKGMPPMEAAREATKDIGLAVMATTLSLVVIFLPVAFMGGIVGRFLQSFGWTAAFAIMVSLLVSFTMTPALCSRFLKVAPKGEQSSGGSRDSRVYAAMDRGYVALLRWSLGHRKTVMALALLVFLSLVPLFQRIGKDFLPQDDESQFEITVQVPEGSSLESTSAVLRQMEEEVVKKLSHVTHRLTLIGADSQQRVNLGSIYVQLIPLTERQETQRQIMDQARQLLMANPQWKRLRMAVTLPARIGGGGFADADVQMTINGPDLNRLVTYAQQIKETARSIPGVVDADTSYQAGKPELRVRINREKAADLGVRVVDIASALRTMVGGDDRVSSYREGDDRYDVQVRLQWKDRNSAEAISELYVPSTRLGNVQLSNLVTLEEGAGPSQIERYNRQRQIMITANILKGSSFSEVLDALNKKVAEMNLPVEYRTGLIGRSREFGRALTNFGMAFLLSLIFMYMILAAQFESFIDPVTILLSLPLSLPFALISLLMFQQTLNIYSAVGMLVLFGIVKKNSILQIDHAKQLRSTGLPRHQAVMQGSRDRLRPILMTTMALVAGMLPMALGQGAGSGARRSVAILVIGGQTLVLLLTLLVTPVAYSIFDDLGTGSFWRGMGGSLRARTRGLGQRAAAALALILSLRGRWRNAPAVNLSKSHRCLIGWALLCAFGGFPGYAQTHQHETHAFSPSPAVQETRVGVDAGKTHALSLREAILLALRNNRDIEIERQNAIISQQEWSAARGSLDPVIAVAPLYRSRTIPVGSILQGGSSGALTERTADVTASVRQQLPWGGNYALRFDISRLTSTNAFVTLNPQFNSVLQLDWIQPLLRNLLTDAYRRDIRLMRKRTDLSDAQFRQRVIEMVTSVQQGYWDLVFALKDVEVHRESVTLAREQLERNRRMVDAGELAPVEIVAAEAELQRRNEDLLSSVEVVTRTENALKQMIAEERTAPIWNEVIVPTEAIEIRPLTFRLDEATGAALQHRPEMEQLRLRKEENQIDKDYYRNQAKPKIDLVGSYATTGLAGRVRAGDNPFSTGNQALQVRVNQLSGLAGLPPLIFTAAQLPSFLIGSAGQSMTNLLRNDFRTVQIGISFEFPLFNRTARGHLGRALAEGRQIDAQRSKLEQQIEAEVRNALQGVQTARQRVKAAQAARIASEQQLQSETRRYAAGESTNFLVLTRQNEYSNGRGREMRALTDYNKALAILQRAVASTLEVFNLQVDSPVPRQ